MFGFKKTKVVKEDVGPETRAILVRKLIGLAFEMVQKNIPHLPDTFMEYEVSSATMREEDLIPTFLSFLRDNSPLMYWNVLLSWEDDDLGHGDPSLFLNEGLFEAMNTIAPDGTFFGSHEGDGARYGFWIADADSFDDEREYKAVCRRAKKAGRWY